MMTRFKPQPVVMGALMGAMGLWMLHGQMTGAGTGAGLVFVLVHVGVIAGVALLVFLGLHKRFTWIARLGRHRPSWRHMGIMLASAALTGAVIHLVHGGPTWI